MEFCKLSSLSDNIYELKLSGLNEHRFNSESIAALLGALDEVEKTENAAVLLVTNEGKYFSNGLDLDVLVKDPSMSIKLLDDFHKLLRRMLTFPIPTIAVICGHAVAGGCMFALTHDYRVMSSDKGLIFVNEVEIGLPLTPGMNAVLRCKMPEKTFYSAVLSGFRFSGNTAVQGGFVDAALPGAEATRQEALTRAKALASRKFNRSIYKALKREMFKKEIKKLELGSTSAVAEGMDTLVSKM